VAEKDSKIKEKERIYHNLKKILARQPGPEISDSLQLYQVRREWRMEVLNISYVTI
jgi:hypothetical protein